MDKEDFMLRWLSQLLLGAENELWTDDMASAASDNLVLGCRILPFGPPSQVL